MPYDNDKSPIKKTIGGMGKISITSYMYTDAFAHLYASASVNVCVCDRFEELILYHCVPE